jgi:GNAT superfamily N-acetyltransferase
MEKLLTIIKNNQLIQFINSDEYKNSENIPISPQRAVSYVNNKRSNPNSPAIILLKSDEKIIAYRCLFEDTIFIENRAINFFWISGSWVHPDFRRQGISTYLLDKTMEITDKKLMFSNYAPESKALYDKSEYFTRFAKIKGKRYYFRFALAKLLPTKRVVFRKTQFILEIADLLINFFIDLRLTFLKKKISHIKYEEPEYFTDEIRNFVEKHNSQNPFKRNIDEFINFIKFPWVLQIKKKQHDAFRYYFSFQAKHFFYKQIILRNENNEIQCFAIVKIRDNHLTLPYIYCEKNYFQKISKIILSLILKYKISYFSIFDKNIIKEFKNFNKFTLHKKKLLRDFFASKELNNIIKNNKFELFDGDGDNVYT